MDAISSAGSTLGRRCGTRLVQVTRRGVLCATASAVGMTVLGACRPAGPAPAGSASVAKRVQGRVEFWSNAGYPYTGRIGAMLVEEFQQKHPGVTIDYTDTTYGDFMQKLVTTTVGGTPPDISYIDRYVTKSFACKGVLQPLDTYMKTSQVARPDAFWPRLQFDITYRGKVWGIPHGPDVGLVYYNKGAFREVGLDPEKPPATWDAAVTAIQRLMKRDGSGSLERIGWAPQHGWGVPWMVMYWQLGGELANTEETQAIFNNEKAVQVFEWLLRVYDLQGGLGAIDEVFKGTNPYDAFANGRMAMVWATHASWELTFKRATGIEIGITYWPTPPSGQRANYMGGWTLGIPRGAKNPDAAFAFLEFLCEDDPQIRWAHEWNNVPATKRAAQSERYLEGRPERKIAVQDMPVAKWVITAPGGDTALRYQTGVARAILSGEKSVRAALEEHVRLINDELSKAQAQCQV